MQRCLKSRQNCERQANSVRITQILAKFAKILFCLAYFTPPLAFVKRINMLFKKNQTFFAFYKLFNFFRLSHDKSVGAENKLHYFLNFTRSKLSNLYTTLYSLLSMQMVNSIFVKIKNLAYTSLARAWG